MKLLKIGLAVIAASAVLFVAGCAKDNATTKAPQKHMVHSKFGNMNMAKDVNK